MSAHQRHGRGFKHFLRDERGAIAIYMTVCLPVFIGFLILCTDGVNFLWTRNLLQVTADAAALNGAGQLPILTNVQTAAQTYASLNMPNKTYGSVLASGDITLVNWSNGASQSCNAPPTTTPCNAVKVVTRYTPKLFFASALQWTAPQFCPGASTGQICATAIATIGYGTGTPGSGSPPTWNTVIAQDISASFKSSITNAQAADQALLTCMDQSSGSGSQLGLTLFTGDASTNPKENPALTNVVANYSALKTAINNYGDCGTSGMPACSGTDIASGVIDGIKQLTSASFTKNLTPGSQQNIIIVSDGQPNSCGPTTVAAKLSNPAYNGKNSKYLCPTACDSNCSPSTDPSNAALAAASLAATDNINISVIYYSGNCSGTQCTTDWTYMQSLVRGKGIALNQPAASSLASDMQQICAIQAARLVQ